MNLKEGKTSSPAPSPFTERGLPQVEDEVYEYDEVKKRFS